MAVEVYQSLTAPSTNEAGGNPYYEDEGFALASFFSGSALFSIIDSYSSVVGRHNGDPITTGGPKWATSADVGKVNDWFVIETIGATAPQWQAKIQWTGSTGFDDPSGLDYGGEGATYELRIRFAPYGGWDSDPTTPDFAPVGPSYNSSGNEVFVAANASYDTRWFIVADTGQLLRFCRTNVAPYRIDNWGSYVGDITPVDAVAQTMPRVIIPSMRNNASGSLDQIDNSSALLTGDLNTVTWGELFSGLAFEDSSGNWVEGGFMQPSATQMLNALSQYNQFDSTPKLDTLPFYVISLTHGMLGTIPLIERAYCPGFVLVDSKNWLGTRAGYGALIRWDGSTDLNF